MSAYHSTAEEPSPHGFYACDADLEDELIRKPAQRGLDPHAQLRRFLGTCAGRKVRYGSLLVDALELDRVPPALDLALARVHR